MADPTNISESEEDEEIKRQLREGQLVLPGVINFNKEYTLRRFSPQGEVRQPTIRSIKALLQELQSDVPTTKYVAKDWVKNPAVQIYWTLARRGVAREDLMKFLAESFVPSELIKIERSRWNMSKGIGVVYQQHQK